MKIARSIETQKGPTDWFAGDVYIDRVAAPAGTSSSPPRSSISRPAPGPPGTPIPQIEAVHARRAPMIPITASL
jgi:hypothetical protein